jgi:dual specificity phosphatase 12
MADAQVIYCCRKCRRPLFSGANVADEAAHDKLSYSFTGDRASPCTSYFLSQPEEWMALTEQEGKLACPKCDMRFGSYVWAGTQCSCGFWVAPGIQVPKSKVDVRLVRPKESQPTSS